MKWSLVILLGLLVRAAPAQTAFGDPAFLSRTFIYPANCVTGALDGWSCVRNIRAEYQGALIRVRRGSDSTEQDIYALAGALDTATIASFCGTSTGYVTTIYAQLGTNNIKQATAANQPQIYNGSAIFIATNGNRRPMIKWDNVNDYMQAVRNTAWVQPISAYHVIQQTSWTLGDPLIDGSTTATFFVNDQRDSSSRIRLYANTALQPTTSFTLGVPILLYEVGNNTASVIGFNNQVAETSGTAGAANPEGITLGAFSNGTVPADLMWQESIIYGTAHDAATRQRLRELINAFYHLF